MFRTHHAIVLHNRPITDFVWVCSLKAKLGLDLGLTYRTTFSAQEFVKSIAVVEFSHVSETIISSKFGCVIGDGRTDYSIKEQEMWFVRQC